MRKKIREAQEIEARNMRDWAKDKARSEATPEQTRSRYRRMAERDFNKTMGELKDRKMPASAVRKGGFRVDRFGKTSDLVDSSVGERLATTIRAQGSAGGSKMLYSVLGMGAGLLGKALGPVDYLRNATVANEGEDQAVERDRQEYVRNTREGRSFGRQGSAREAAEKTTKAMAADHKAPQEHRGLLGRAAQSAGRALRRKMGAR